METILLSIVLVLSVAWLVIRMRQGKTDVKSDEAKKRAHEKVAYHAVSMRIEKNACERQKRPNRW